ncbi:MAG: hypothetical protein WDN04_19355 [Rhodospirillales bacterium]
MLPGLKGKLAQAASLSIVGPDGTITLRRAPGASKPADGLGFADKGGYPVSGGNREADPGRAFGTARHRA